MDMDTDLIAVKEEQLQVEEADDSCKIDFIEIVPLTSDTCTTEYDSGDWCGSEVDLTDLKQEPDDVCCVLYPVFSLSQQKDFVQVLGNSSIFSERELTFMLSSHSLFAVACPSVISLSSVTFVHLAQPLKFSAMFVRHLVPWPSIDIC